MRVLNKELKNVQKYFAIVYNIFLNIVYNKNKKG